MEYIFFFLAMQSWKYKEKFNDLAKQMSDKLCSLCLSCATIFWVIYLNPIDKNKVYRKYAGKLDKMISHQLHSSQLQEEHYLKPLK